MQCKLVAMQKLKRGPAVPPMDIRTVHEQGMSSAAGSFHSIEKSISTPFRKGLHTVLCMHVVLFPSLLISSPASVACSSRFRRACDLSNIRFLCTLSQIWLFYHGIKSHCICHLDENATLRRLLLLCNGCKEKSAGTHPPPPPPFLQLL